jgi:hypothetical protein
VKINLRATSVQPTLDLLRRLADGNRPGREEIGALLAHPDYDFEFRRYGADRRAMTEFLLSLPAPDPDALPALCPDRPDALRQRRPLWQGAFRNPDAVELRFFDAMFSLRPSELREICADVRAAFPFDPDLGDVDVVLTLGIGPSYGYVFEGALHMDVLSLILGGAPRPVLAHELHHIAIRKFASGFVESLTSAELFIFTFSGEGLAVKFMNNARGALSKPVRPGEPECAGLDASAMDHWNARFAESVEMFFSTLRAMEQGGDAARGAWERFEGDWWNPVQGGRTLAHGRIYAFGNDLYGAIYDAHGLDATFDAVRHPLRAAQLFRALLPLDLSAF